MIKSINKVGTACCLICLILIIGCTNNYQEKETISPQIAEANLKETGQLRHVVLFKFKEDAVPAAIKKVEDAFIALPGKIPEIKDFEWGLNNSPEGLNKGLTHCYLITFESEEGREIYLPHPEHKAFVGLLEDILDDVTVVDYWAK